MAQIHFPYKCFFPDCNGETLASWDLEEVAGLIARKELKLHCQTCGRLHEADEETIKLIEGQIKEKRN